jgi:negative regulator of flagellin synthesis FlgM
MSIKIGSSGIDKINNEFIQKDLKKIKQNEEETANIASEDKVELSSRAMDLKELHARAAAAPDVRTEKVEEIKMQVDNGTYSIDTGKIAEKVIEDALE